MICRVWHYFHSLSLSVFLLHAKQLTVIYISRRIYVHSVCVWSLEAKKSINNHYNKTNRWWCTDEKMLFLMVDNKFQYKGRFDGALWKSLDKGYNLQVWFIILWCIIYYTETSYCEDQTWRERFLFFIRRLKYMFNTA